MKPVRLELSSVLTVLSVPAALSFVFPFGAIGFRPASRPAPSGASAAFVAMSDEEQVQAMRSAKTSWQVNASGERMLRADLSVGELPEDPSLSSLEIVSGPTRSPRSVVDSPLAAYPRSLAAPAVKRIPREAEAESRPPAFPKSELLKID